MSSTTDQAQRQAQQDAQHGLGPQNTSNWSAPNRQAYDATYNQNKK